MAVFSLHAAQIGPAGPKNLVFFAFFGRFVGDRIAEVSGDSLLNRRVS